MPNLPLYQVDAFADRPFAGNPAAVCLVEAPIPEAVMQQIAAENNLAETAFIDVGRGSGAEVLGLRWFTPTVEVELCGHATLASGFVLLTEIARARAKVTFQTRSGLLSVERGEGGEMVLDLPLSAPQEVDGATKNRVGRAIGVEPRQVVLGKAAYFAELESAAAVRAVTPDFAAVAAFGTSVCVTATGADEATPVDFVSRFFAPAHGIPEDPVTGSAHCTLAPYWAARLGKRRLRARQVSRRGGELTCAVDGERVRLGGACQLVITGTFRI
ncbi:MAG TPA: PhzF family phenazine biosynthesis protein [Polyangia bacterium]|jgi:PhzF family phenazine biosynthesis protein|nr:PhzF family phenazine biosynthesis protein [Polyangia bacterium]